VAIADFIHLKVRSAYSLTEGANKVDKVVSLAKEAEMPAVAVTDRNNLFGALEFASAHQPGPTKGKFARCMPRQSASPKPQAWSITLTTTTQSQAGM
jgi:DNA polymerase-3 subunit alpha